MHFVTYHTIALILYIGLAAFFFYRLHRQQVTSGHYFLGLTAIATTLQAIGLYSGIFQAEGVDLSLSHMASLVSLSVNAVVLASSWRKPLHSLFIFLLPLSIVVIASILFIESMSASAQNSTSYLQLSVGMGLHVLLSIAAYSLLFAAVLQALLVSWQDHHLKNRQLSGIAQYLPPLQTMESLLFKFVWVGVVLLTIALISGIYYIDNIFEQHLAHKTLLSLIAWAVFALLLYGRVTRGWRGNYAVRWVLGGFCVLMLAYFGSKLVLEVILV
ncbi:cytochrome C assembly family protein [Eionea flava]